MSTPRCPLPARPFLSVLSAHWEHFPEGLLPQLQAYFGPVDYTSELLPFNGTSYYDAELGAPLFRRILSFSRPIPLDALAEAKLHTNAMENAYTQTSGRLFNLDPGYITCERLVLATGKNFVHRIYLGQGIWADLTLIFHRGDWYDLPWTFPDYTTPAMKIHLSHLRNLYKAWLSQHAAHQ